MEMNRDQSRIYYSPKDEERFGARTARAVDVTEKSVPGIFKFCRENRIELLIARCRASEIRAAQALEREGCFLADTLVRYVRNLVKIPIPELSGRFAVRPAAEEEDAAVGRIAADAFNGYGGHYQADERLAHVPAAEIYASWAVNSCRHRDHIHDVLVAELRGKVVGFITVRLNSPAEGEGHLAGAASAAGKRSLVMRDLSIGSMNWFRSRGATRCIASLLITNRVMQKIMSRLDFEPGEFYYTFHRWF